MSGDLYGMPDVNTDKISRQGGVEIAMSMDTAHQQDMLTRARAPKSAGVNSVQRFTSVPDIGVFDIIGRDPLFFLKSRNGNAFMRQDDNGHLRVCGAVNGIGLLLPETVLEKYKDDLEMLRLAMEALVQPAGFATTNAIAGPGTSKIGITCTLAGLNTGTITGMAPRPGDFVELVFPSLTGPSGDLLMRKRKADNTGRIIMEFRVVSKDTTSRTLMKHVSKIINDSATRSLAMKGYYRDVNARYTMALQTIRHGFACGIFMMRPLMQKGFLAIPSQAGIWAGLNTAPAAAGQPAPPTQYVAGTADTPELRIDRYLMVLAYWLNLIENKSNLPPAPAGFVSVKSLAAQSMFNQNELQTQFGRFRVPPNPAATNDVIFNKHMPRAFVTRPGDTQQVNPLSSEGDMVALQQTHFTEAVGAFAAAHLAESSRIVGKAQTSANTAGNCRFVFIQSYRW